MVVWSLNELVLTFLAKVSVLTLLSIAFTCVIVLVMCWVQRLTVKWVVLALSMSSLWKLFESLESVVRLLCRVISLLSSKVLNLRRWSRRSRVLGLRLLVWARTGRLLSTVRFSAELMV